MYKLPIFEFFISGVKRGNTGGDATKTAALFMHLLPQKYKPLSTSNPKLWLFWHPPFSVVDGPILKPFGVVIVITLLGGSSFAQGFVNKNLGSSPGWWAATVATSYLLSKQAGGTPQIRVDKTSTMTGRLRVYRISSQNWSGFSS